jgi:hypothetical protein
MLDLDDVRWDRTRQGADLAAAQARDPAVPADPPAGDGPRRRLGSRRLTTGRRGRFHLSRFAARPGPASHGVAATGSGGCPARSCAHQILPGRGQFWWLARDLHTICKRSALLLHARRLQCFVIRPRPTLSGTGGIGLATHAVTAEARARRESRGQRCSARSARPRHTRWVH